MRKPHAPLKVLAVAAASVAIALAGCSVGPLASSASSVSEARASKASALEPTTTSTVEEGVLTVGVDASASSAPFFIGLQDGTVTGIDVDLAAALADEMGLSVRFVSVDDPESALGSTCDVVMSAEDEEYDGATVVGSYAESATAFFHNGDMGIAEVDDLSSKTVGVQAGSVSDKALSNTGLVMEEVSFDNLNDAFEALSDGEVDYVLCDAYSGAYLSMYYEDVSFAGCLGEPAPTGIAVSSDNSELQTALASALETVQGNGLGDLLRQRWVGGMENLTTDTQVQDVPAKGTDTSDSSSTTTQDASVSDDASDSLTVASNAVTI